jgi:hypothetical protein
MSLEQASKDFAVALLALATAVAQTIVPAGGQAVAETPAATKPKKEPKPKEEKAAEPAGPTAKQVADSILLLAETNREAAVAILGTFGVRRVGELKPADYAAAFKLASDANAAPAVVANDSLV